jgi:hypothetical protein
MEELPWDFLFVMGTIAVTIVLPVILLAGFLDLKKRKLQSQARPENALTTGELEDLIGSSVRDATSDLEEQVLRLDRRVTGLEHRLTSGGEDLSEKPDIPDEQPTVTRSFGRLRS